MTSGGGVAIQGSSDSRSMCSATASAGRTPPNATEAEPVTAAPSSVPRRSDSWISPGAARIEAARSADCSTPGGASGRSAGNSRPAQRNVVPRSGAASRATPLNSPSRSARPLRVTVASPGNRPVSARTVTPFPSRSNAPRIWRMTPWAIVALSADSSMPVGRSGWGGRVRRGRHASRSRRPAMIVRSIRG